MEFEDYKQYLSPALAKATDLVVTKGKGSYLFTASGEKYLDFVQGIAVNALGHCHPAVVSAIREQSSKLIDASFNLVNFEPTLRLAKRIAEKAPGELGCTFFSNGGAEAIDGAIKLAKAYTKRPAIIAFKGSFHGRTIGASTVTASNSKYRKYYEPMMGSTYFATYPSRDLCPKGMDEAERSAFCLDEIRQLFDYIVAPEMVAAVLMEPVQGEGGYVVPPKSFVEGVRKLCSEHGILLIFDEIQAGYGRTGKMFAGENFGVVPDIMTLGKAIGGGLPMSAVVSTPKIMAEWHPGMHGTTFGGNPVAAAAGNAVLDVFETTDILSNVLEQGSYLKTKLFALQKKYDCISDVRGLGLMLAIEFSHKDGTPGGDLWAKVKQRCFENHLLTLNCGVHGNGLRFATCLNVTKDVIDEGVGILDKSIGSALYK